MRSPRLSRGREEARGPRRTPGSQHFRSSRAGQSRKEDREREYKNAGGEPRDSMPGRTGQISEGRVDSVVRFLGRASLVKVKNEGHGW